MVGDDGQPVLDDGVGSPQGGCLPIGFIFQLPGNLVRPYRTDLEDGLHRVGGGREDRVQAQTTGESGDGPDTDDRSSLPNLSTVKAKMRNLQGPLGQP